HSEGLAQLDARLPPAWARGGGGGERTARYEYDYDQRPPGWSDEGGSQRPPPLRPPPRPSRFEPLARPPVKQAAPGIHGVGRGARVKHATFGVGTVEGSDGAGDLLKL